MKGVVELEEKNCMSRMREVVIYNGRSNKRCCVRLVQMLPQRNRDNIIEPLSRSLRAAHFLLWDHKRILYKSH